MKVLTTILFCAFLSINAFSQTASRDVIYLKNGDILKGQIIEMKFGDKVKIETSDGSIFTKNFSEIDRVEKEPVPNATVSTTTNAPAPSETEGLVAIAENDLKKRITEDSKGLMSFVSFKKVDGLRENKDGVPTYTITCEVTTLALSNFYCSSGDFGGYSFYVSKKTQKEDFGIAPPPGTISESGYNTGDKLIFKEGTIYMVKSDNGWKVKSISRFGKLFYRKGNGTLPNAGQSQSGNDVPPPPKVEIPDTPAKNLQAKYTTSKSVLGYTDLNLSATPSKCGSRDWDKIKLAMQTFLQNNQIKEGSTATDAVVADMAINISKFEYENETGTDFLTGKPFSGYRCLMRLEVTTTSKSGEKATKSYDLRGGVPASNHTKEEAFEKILPEINKVLAVQINQFFPIECKYAGIIKQDSKTGLIKKIKLISPYEIPSPLSSSNRVYAIKKADLADCKNIDEIKTKAIAKLRHNVATIFNKDEVGILETGEEALTKSINANEEIIYILLSKD